MRMPFFGKKHHGPRGQAAIALKRGGNAGPMTPQGPTGIRMAMGAANKKRALGQPEQSGDPSFE